ncbi:MAG: tyrosine-type recombinase/integrase [Planctomycetaceae bacterium]|nr:tyrosine-type recombinase/integrase [Planctomycetaceae bacterium]
MASIFKLGRDKENRRSPYYVEYVDHTGRTRRKKGYTDKSLTMQLATKLEKDAMLRRQGLIDPDEEETAIRRRVPLTEHLEAFEQSLKRKRNTEEYVGKTTSRIRKIITEAGFEIAADIDIESVEQVLIEMLEAGDIGHRTYNHYVQAMDSFCRWMVPKRLASNPLHGMQRLNTEEDVRHQRRALSGSEVAMLIQSAKESGETIQKYDGELRARLYLFAYMTGLRRRELSSLTPRSFDLKAKQPTVVVEAACSKHRRRDVLPLHAELILLLTDWLPELQPDEPLFPMLAKRKAWLMVKKDLERIGILYRNQDGVADFHAAGRHSYVTGLLKNGATLPEAKELARHSDIRMTMKYTHVGLDDQARALASLPRPEPPSDDDLNEGITQESVSELVSDWSGEACNSLSPTDTVFRDEQNENPGENRGCDDECLCLSSVGDDCEKWRIGDSNP